jgi:hypothetical protein
MVMENIPAIAITIKLDLKVIIQSTLGYVQTIIGGVMPGRKINRGGQPTT